MSTPTTPTVHFSQIAPLLQAQIACNRVPFLAGDPGIGKSASIKAIGDALGTKTFVLSMNQLGTKEDLTGARTIPDKKHPGTFKQVFFPHAIVQECIDYANEHPDETPLLFLDEINRTSADVTSAVLALITERRLGTVKLPDNIRMIAAGNDKGNVNVLDDASLTRMAIYHVAPDAETFLNAQPDLNYYIKTLIKKHPDDLLQTSANLESDSDDDNDDDASLSDLDDMFAGESNMAQLTVPRTLTYTSDLLNQLGFDGHSLPSNIDELVDPINPEDSTLYFGLVAQLGQTKTTDDLFNMILSSIEQLSATPNQTQTTKPAYHLPRAVTIKALSGLDSDDATQAYVDDTLSKLNKKQASQFIGWISLTENIAKTKNRPAILHIIDLMVNGQADNLLEGMPTMLRNLTTLSIDPDVKEHLLTPTANAQMRQYQATIHIMLD